MTLAVEHPQRLRCAWVNRPVAWLSVAPEAPVRLLLGAFTALTLAAGGLASGGGQPEISEEELRTLVDVGAPARAWWSGQSAR